MRNIWRFLSILRPTSLVIFSTTMAAQYVFAQSCPLPPAAPTPVITACTPEDGSHINSLPYTIITSGNYCLNFSPSINQTGGITINASNVNFKGGGRTIRGPINILNAQNVTISDINSTSKISILSSQHDPIVPATRNIVVQRSSFRSDGGGGWALELNASNEVSILNSRFTCSCNQADTESHCVQISPTWFPELPISSQLIQNFTFDGNVVDSDCVKSFYLIGGTKGESPIVKQTITNNYFRNTRNTTVGNEMANLTWRSSPGSPDEALRNKFANNSMVSEGNAACMYLRDDLDNVDFDRNCCELKNPNKLAVFYGGIKFSSGADAPATDVSGARFTYNRFLAVNDPAMDVGGIEENAVSENNRTLFRRNIFASLSTVAVRYGSHTGGLWDQNTFYSGSATEPAIDFDNPTLIRQTDLTNNIFACKNTKENIRYYCLKPFADRTQYGGSNNLLFNYASPLIQIYNGGPISLSSWQALGEDPGSRGGNPLFRNPLNFDFFISEASAARSMGTMGQDVGAIPYNGSGWSSGPTDPAPAAPSGLSVQ